jgi:hypothetical protein
VIRQRGARCWAIWGVIALATAGCTIDADQERAVRTWLECLDCGEEALAAVDSLADFDMETALVLAMMGPPDSVRARVAEHLRASYRMAMRELGAVPDRAAEDEYVRGRLAGFVAGYQWRAVTALGRIGTPRARRALRWALRFGSWYPPHVATEIRTQLADSIVPVSATIDTVVITAEAPYRPTVRVYRAGSPWSGAAVRFATDGMGYARGSYAISDANGLAAVGAWFADSTPGLNLLLAKIPHDTVRFSIVGIH